MALSVCNTVTDEHGRELTVHGTPLFPVASYLDDLAIDEVPWHWHEELEVSVVESGTAVFSVDGERRMLEAGSGYFVNSGVLHGAWEAATGAGRMHATVFGAAAVYGQEDCGHRRGLRVPGDELFCKGFPGAEGLYAQRVPAAETAGGAAGIGSWPQCEFVLPIEMQKGIIRKERKMVYAANWPDMIKKEMATCRLIA